MDNNKQVPFDSNKKADDGNKLAVDNNKIRSSEKLHRQPWFNFNVYPLLTKINVLIYLYLFILHI